MIETERFRRLHAVVGHLAHLEECDLIWLARRIREREIPLSLIRADAAEIALESPEAAGVL